MATAPFLTAAYEVRAALCPFHGCEVGTLAHFMDEETEAQVRARVGLGTWDFWRQSGGQCGWEEGTGSEKCSK